MTALAPMRHSASELALPSDRARLRELLLDAVPDCHPETAREVEHSWPHFRVFRDERGVVIAAGALEPLDEERAEIRGLVVDRRYRGLGLAGDIVRELIENARSLELDTVCVTRRPEFFRRFGFEPTEPTWTLPLRRQRRRTAAVGRPRVAMTLAEARS